MLIQHRTVNSRRLIKRSTEMFHERFHTLKLGKIVLPISMNPESNIKLILLHNSQNADTLSKCSSGYLILHRGLKLNAKNSAGKLKKKLN